MLRRNLLRTCAAGLTAVASTSLTGCSSSDNGGDDTTTGDGVDGSTTTTSSELESTATGTPESTATATETVTETETATETATATETTTSPVTELPTYEFVEGESYTYDTVFAGSESEEIWSVTSVEDDQVTVERQTVVDGETETTTYSGTQDSIFDVIDEERDISVFPIARNMLIYGQGRDLTAGSTFTIATPSESTDWDSETVEVAGERTVNGVNCTELTATPDISGGEEEQRTTCLADGYPFAISLAIQSDGETLLEMTLTDATRP